MGRNRAQKVVILEGCPLLPADGEGKQLCIQVQQGWELLGGVGLQAGSGGLEMKTEYKPFNRLICLVLLLVEHRKFEVLQSPLVQDCWSLQKGDTFSLTYLCIQLTNIIGLLLHFMHVARFEG